MDRRFEGRTALVTGGSNGLGRAIVAGLLEEGASVAILDLVPCEPRVAERVLMKVGDVGDHGVAAGAVEEAVERFGQLDILINDAASYPDGAIVDMPVDEWRRVFDVNVAGPFSTIQAFARHCIDRGAEDACVVNITTGSVKSPRPLGGAYSSSKAALETLSKVAAMELGPHGIRVNVVSPGYIDVRGWSEAFPDRADDELRARLVESIPLGRAGRPPDIAGAVLYLCSDAARHVSGAVLDVDGGSLAGRFTTTSNAERVRG